MGRRLIVETEAVLTEADGADARRYPGVAINARRRRRLPFRVVYRVDRVLREGVENIGQHQLLMLLLVMQSDLHDRYDSLEYRLIRALQQFGDRGIDMGAIGGHLFDARTGDQTALRPGVPR